MGQGIEFNYKSADHLPGVVILSIKGSIDSDTAHIFEEELVKLMDDDKAKILVDLTNVEYISSAGVGIFVGMVSEFRDLENGDIKACHVSPKIMKVFESIGLDEMLEFYSDPSALKKWVGGEAIIEELDHFDISFFSEAIAYRGEPIKIKVEAKNNSQETITDYHGRPDIKVNNGMVIPNQIDSFRDGVWNGIVTINASGNISLTVDEDGKQGVMELTLSEKTKKAIFPMTVNCKTCQAEIIVNAPDIYRCEVCDETFQVDDWGHIITIRSGSTAKRRKSKYKGMELKINTDVNYMGVIRTSLKGLCEKEGMSPETTNEVVLAVEEIILNLIEHGNDFDPWQVLILRVLFQKKQVKIQIRDYGDSFDITKKDISTIKSNVLKGKKRGVGAFMVNKIMDQVKYTSLKNYNELTMVKRYGPEDETE